MKKRNAIILFFIVLLISGIATLGFMYYLDKFNIRGFVDVATWVAIGILAIGGFSMMGGSSGKLDYSQDAARSVSSDRAAFDRAEHSRIGSSLAFGLVLIVSAILWGAIAYLVYHFFGN